MRIGRNSVAWITGGSSGIGLSAARALGRLGAIVIISGRRIEALKLAISDLTADGIRAEFACLDVTDRNECARVSSEIIRTHGHVDVLVNSAGLNVAQRSWQDVEPSSWESVFRTNVDGSFYCIRSVLPSMRSMGQGLIINVSSWAGRFDVKSAGPAYGAAKHAVCSMTRSLNMEEARHGIRATALCPGETATPIMQKRAMPPSTERMNEMLQLEDFEKVFCFIAQMPGRVCVNELVISPTKNASFT